MVNDVFQDTIDQIKDFERKYGYELGWRFLTCSKSVLKNNPKIAFISLNPGGSKPRDDHSQESCEDGSAYLYETWKEGKNPGESPLQIQVQKMFRKIREKTNYRGSEHELIESTLSGYLIPFRSKSLKDLPHEKEAFDFGEEIWLKILKTVRPNLIVCIDRKTTECLRKIIKTAYNLPKSRLYELPTGWGKYTADIFEFGDNAEVKLLRLPHLSRFTLFTGEARKEPLDKIFSQFCS